VHLVYMDDAKDERNLCFSALIVPAAVWNDALDHLIGMRQQMSASDGIYRAIELHATDWIGGRGNVARFVVAKGARARLFDYVLSCIARIPGIQIINAFGSRQSEMRLFERLMNRIDRNMRQSDSKTVIIADDGKNYDKLLRRMRRHNFIPSRFGHWETGSPAKNIPAERILEDLIYRDSRRSLFVQAADFCAFALLRSESPTPATKRLNVHKSFRILEPALVKQAFGNDPSRMGIIRDL
jgi:hypothetical protein